jgi:peptidoglycan/LPS O-acetylase OafA/YrhL
LFPGMKQSELPVDSNYFQALTGVRAIAAWLVFFHHYNPFSAEQFGSVINQFVQEFHVGVSIFFVLSGFLITHRYFRLPSGFRWQPYLVNRIARVFPMYFLITTLTFILQADSSWLLYFLNITFLRGFFDELKFSLVGQGWSLTVEECFYLLAPIGFFFVRKSKNCLIVLPVFLVGVGCLLVFFFGSKAGYGFFGDFNFMFIYTFFGRCFEFFAGVALAVFLRPNSRQGSWLTWAGLLIATGLVFVMSRLGSQGVSGIQSSTGLVINNLLLPVAIAIFFYGLIREQSIIRSFLSMKPLQILGKASYTFYLIHVGVISLWVDAYLNGNLLMLFVLLNLLAIALWWLLEDPLNRLIKQWFVRQ